MSKAHVLPRALYADLLEDQKHALLLVPPKGEREKRSRIGVYDKELLCRRCEARFQYLDQYAYEVFFRRKRSPDFFNLDKPIAEKIENINPSRLRMFFVFLLWRMHETKHVMFQGMKLGPYAEKCRLALLAEDTSLVPEIDVVITRFTDDKHGGFLGPTKLRIQGVFGFRVHFARHVAWVKVDQKPFLSPFYEASIRDRDSLHILLREFEGSPEKRAMVVHVKSRAK